WPLIASSATFALNSAENRLRVLMVDYPLHSRIHLNRLSQETGPPLLARNSLGSNEALLLFLTKAPLFLLARAALSPDEGRARQGNYNDSPRKGTHDLVNVARPSIEAGLAAWSLPAQEREIAQARRDRKSVV